MIPNLQIANQALPDSLRKEKVTVIQSRVLLVVLFMSLQYLQHEHPVSPYLLSYTHLLQLSRPSYAVHN